MQITSWLVRFVDHVYEYSRLYSVIVLLASVAMISGIYQLQLNSSNEALFHESDPVLKAYQELQSEFGRNDVVVIAIQSTEVRTVEFYNSLKELHLDLEKSVPWVEDVTSLVNADWVESESPGQLKVANVGDLWPDEGRLTPEELRSIAENSLYRDTLISKDGEMILLIVRAMSGIQNMEREGRTDNETDFFSDQTQQFFMPDQESAQDKGLTSEELNQFASGIQEVVNRHKKKGLTILSAGGPLLDKLHHDAMHHDVIVLMGAAFLIVIIALYLLFRDPIAVLLPLIVVVLALASVFGTMGWIGIPITPVSQALPSLLLTVGVLDAVHLFGMFYLVERQGKLKKEALLSAFEHSGVAVLFTSLTTAAGFVAFTFARMKPISDFGWVASLGTLLIFVYTLILLPALIKIFYRPRKGHAKSLPGFAYLVSLMVFLSGIGARHPAKVMLMVGLIVLLGIPGIQRIEFSYDVLSWFPKEEPIRVETLAIDKKIQATVPLEVVVDTHAPKGILTPKFMAALREFQDYAEQMESGVVKVGRATSIVDALEQIHSQIANVQRGTLPNGESLIHQELLLYESGGAKEMSRLTDSEFSKARITIRLAWSDGKNMVPLREKIEAKAKTLFDGIGQVQVTGTVDLVATGTMDLIFSMGTSYLFAAISITLMLVMLWSSIRLGVMAAIPNFIVIYIALAIIGYTGMTINIVTVLLGGIVLGLAVDDTVHFINAMKHRIIHKEENLSDAIEKSMKTVGPMLLVTTLVLSLGFSMFIMSMMSVLKSFGVLLSMTMILALVFDVLVIPAILSLLKHGRNEYGIDGNRQDDSNQKGKYYAK